MKKKFVLLVFLIVVGICIPVVSASELILDENLYESVDTSNSYTYGVDFSAYGANYPITGIRLKDIAKFAEFSYLVIDASGDNGYWREDESYINEGRYDITYEFDGLSHDGAVYVNRYTNLFGTVTLTRYTVFFGEWSIGELTGAQIIDFPFIYYNKSSRDSLGANYDIGLVSEQGGCGFAPHKSTPITFTHASGIPWKNKLMVSEESGLIPGYRINLTRTFDGKPYSSILEISKDSDVVYFSNKHGTFEDLWFPKTDINKINITSPSEQVYSYSLDAGDPGEPDEPSSITVYVKNSQTGALIADANIVIDALVNGEYYPVVNRTEPSGIFTITLQPTGGGQPNPDGYRLIVTADGYNNPMPEINFTVDEYKNYIHCLLDPIAGGPADENKTFIDFFVRDMASNPISGATVKFGKYTLITNSAGYTVFEVDKNNNYSWTVSKSGYGPLTGNAVIGNDPRHTINTVLAPIVTPTTPIPTSPPIGPTPTMTAPTGEPVSNWLEWFAAHFGMILGGGVEIGKIFMWLSFTVPVGVYVGKESKAGAAGFMAGAGIVTLFFVLIGWVPIWLVVLLALIIGLLYAKVFNAQDNGGGR